LAQTGTGKTAAYGIPVLQKLDTDDKSTQALVLSPTRELCLQIADDMNSFAKFMHGVHIVPVYGGASIETQIHALKHGVQVIVATPGRLIDLMKRGVAKLDKVQNVVLDEADEMLNMGFSDSINEIFAGVPADRNTLLFSATMSKEIEKIALNYLHDYKEIVVGSRNEGAENVNHIYFMVNAKDKYLALKRIVDFYPKIYAIIFCRTKRETQDVADKLIRDGYNAESLHGDLSQAQRDLTMQKFRNHVTQLLVATDVAARGLDVEDLTHVINYGLPDDLESYTHRSGRTGRAGKSGTSISIIHTRERSKVRAIEKEIGKSFVEGVIPSSEEICKKQLYKAMDEIVKTDVSEEEIEPFMADIDKYFDCIDKEDLIKKIVTHEFGQFLAYYANAPEIEKPSGKREGRGGESRGESRGRGGENRDRGGRSRGPRKAESGYRRLFINLGKDEGFFPGEVMQFVNKNVSGHPELGHIDLMQRQSYIEVPEKDADRVARSLTGTNYKGREVRCNDADEGGHGERNRDRRSESRGRRVDRGSSDGYEKRPRRSTKRADSSNESGKSDDWKQFFRGAQPKLKGSEPDFSEEGWAKRKPRKK
jgi:ATP-dependent RNA helicase DeaD